MALKAILNSLEGLAPELAEHYTEEGGRFVLAVSAAEGYALENVAGLKSSLAKERENVKKMAAASKAYEGLDPAEAREAIAKVGEMADYTPEEKVREIVAAKEKQLAAKHGAELEKVAAEEAAIKSQLENNLVKAAAVEALNAHSGNVELLLPHVMQKARMVKGTEGKYIAEVIDANGTPRVTMAAGSTAPMGIEELVTEMRENAAYAPAFAGSGATGSGAASSTAAGGSTGGRFTISQDEARNPETYRAARAAAEKAGSTLEIT